MQCAMTQLHATTYLLLGNSTYTPATLRAKSFVLTGEQFFRLYGLLCHCFVQLLTWNVQ